MIELSLDDIRALHEAYDDTCRAWCTYDRVVRDFGPQAPFRELRDDQARHMEKLEALFRHYGMQLPNTRCREPVPHFKDLAAAQAAAERNERENVATYGRLSTTAREPGLRQEIAALERATAERHVPALLARR